MPAETTEPLPALDRISIDYVMTADGRAIHFETMPVGSLPDRIWDAVLDRYNAHPALVAALRAKNQEEEWAVDFLRDLASIDRDAAAARATHIVLGILDRARAALRTAKEPA